jgi:hypothetical protein
VVNILIQVIARPQYLCASNSTLPLH